MSKREQLTDLKENEEGQVLKDIIQKYIKISKELEKRESKVLKQVELVHSAVASLQTWNQNFFPSTSRSVHTYVENIEEESKKIKEETERIQEEVKQKIEENKKLQEEINRRKLLDSRKEDELRKWVDEEGRIRGIERKETDSRMTKTKRFPNDDSESGIQFFNDKLQKLEEMKKELQKQSEIEERKKMVNFKGVGPSENKESKVDKDLIKTWKRKLEKK